MLRRHVPLGPNPATCSTFLLYLSLTSCLWPHALRLQWSMWITRAFKAWQRQNFTSHFVLIRSISQNSNLDKPADSLHVMESPAVAAVNS